MDKIFFPQICIFHFALFNFSMKFSVSFQNAKFLRGFYFTLSVLIRLMAAASSYIRGIARFPAL